MKSLNVGCLIAFGVLSLLLVACDFSTSEEIAEKEASVSCPKALACPDTLEPGTICDARDGKIYEWDSLAAYAMEQAGDENNSLRSTESWDLDLVTPGNDVFGFNALASGRYYFRAFTDMGFKAYFWTNESENSETAYIRSLSGMINTMGFGNSFKDSGLSVRCLKDESE